MASKKQSITEGALVLTVALAIEKLVSLVYKFPLIAQLAGGGWGYYQTAYNIYSAVYAVAVTGFPTAVSKFIAGYVAEGRYRDAEQIRKEALKLFAVIGGVCSVGLAAAAKAVCNAMGNPNAYLAVLIVSPSVFFCCIMSAYRGYYQGMSNMTPTAVSQVVEVMIKAVVGYCSVVLTKHFLYKEYEAYGTVFGRACTESTVTSAVLSAAAAAAIFGVTVSTLVGYLTCVHIYKKNGSGVSIEMIEASPEPENAKVMRRMILRFGFPLAITAICLRVTSLIDNMTVIVRLNNIIATDLETIYASHHGLLEQISVETADLSNYLYEVYGYAIPLFDLIPTITANFGASAFPHISAAANTGRTEKVKRQVESVINITMLIAAPCGFGLAFMAHPLLDFLYPALPVGAALATPMLVILGVAAVSSCLASSVNTMLQATGNIDAPVKLMLMGCVVKVAANYILVGIPELNIKAAAAGNFFCYLVMCVIGLIWLCRTAKIHISVLRTVVKPIIAGIFCGAVARLVYYFCFKAFTNRISCVISIGFAAVMYLLVILKLNLISREEIYDMPAGARIVRLLEKAHLIG